MPRYDQNSDNLNARKTVIKLYPRFRNLSPDLGTIRSEKGHKNWPSDHQSRGYASVLHTYWFWLRVLTRELHTIVSGNRGFRDHRWRPSAVHFLGRNLSYTYAWTVVPGDIWNDTKCMPYVTDSNICRLVTLLFLLSWLFPPLAVDWGTVLQAGRSRVRFQMVSLEFFFDIILPAELWSWGWFFL